MPKPLALIVMDDAGGDLESLLTLVAQRYADDPDWFFLCVGGEPSGQYPQAAKDQVAESSIEFLRSPVSQDPGGYQKLGLRYALEAGFDLVVKLGTDGPAALDHLPLFLASFESSGADVILGSPIADRSDAGRARCDRLLTWLQGLITGRPLRGYQTSLRAYSSTFLRSIPFEINSNGPLFDTEILLQALNAGTTIGQLDLPAKKPGASHRGGGIRYAMSTLKATIAYRMHQVGMLCSLKYRRLGSDRYRDKTWTPYSSHAKALEVVRQERPGTLLDLGCGPGHVAKLCEDMGVRVTGVDREAPEPGVLKDFHRCDLEATSLPIDALAFDMVLMLDIIEHLASPEDFLVGLRHASKRSASDEVPRMVITTPNIAFASIRLNLLLGRFNYAERGILDITHKRLFTRRSLLTALEDCGYRVERLVGIGAPFEAVMEGHLGRALGIVSDGLARVWPSLFAFQFLVVCRPLPGVRQLLSESRRLSAAPPA